MSDQSDPRLPLSDLEKLAKLSDQVHGGALTEKDAITRLACDIVGPSVYLPRITGDQIESLSRMISGYARYEELERAKERQRYYRAAYYDASGNIRPK